MLFEDSDVVRLSDEYVFLSEGSTRQVPDERLGEYRRLFKELGIEAGFHRDGANASFPSPSVTTSNARVLRSMKATHRGMMGI